MQIKYTEDKKINDCVVRVMHIYVDDFEWSAGEILDSITETSWLKDLSRKYQESYSARMKATIILLKELMVNNLDQDWNLTSEFGEYLISHSARKTLNENHGHKLSPLPELWKEKSKWNPWFDFHSENSDCIIFFWEAKYRAEWTPHSNAIGQIAKFIEDFKDRMDIADLTNFFSAEAEENFYQWKKWFTAAFSMNAKSFSTILENLFKPDAEIHKLTNHPEIFIIAVELWI